MGCALLA